MTMAFGKTDRLLTLVSILNAFHKLPMTKALLATLIALSLLPQFSHAEPPAERFEDVLAHAQRMGLTEQGATYQRFFSETIARPMKGALQECAEDTKPPYVVNVVFVIGADGTTQRIIAAPDQPASACVARKLAGLKLPAPPKAGWLISVKITVNP